MAERQVFIIDIGASKVSAGLAICARGNRIFDIFTEFTKRRNVSSDTNLRYSSDLSDIISAMKSSLEKKSNVRLKNVCVNIDSQFVSCRLSRAQVALAQRSCRPILFSDVKRVKNQARYLGLKLDEEVLHEFPSSFIIDSDYSIPNPVGKLARKLEVNLFLVTSKTLEIDNLARMINGCGLKLKTVSFSGLAAASAILNSKKNMQNAVVVDIGAVTTKIVSFNCGLLCDIKVIPFAGNDITEAIAGSLKTTKALAEELKKRYGSVAPESLQSKEDIMVKTRNSYKTIKRSQISKAMAGKAEKLINSLKSYLDSLSLERPRIFVCGGTALLDGFLEALESRISSHVVLGRPNVDFLPFYRRNSFFKNPAQATMVGLLTLKSSILMPPSSRPKRGEFLTQAIQKARQVYCEYF